MALILNKFPLGFVWPTLDPFLFCVHHDDRYPKGNDSLGPAASLAGRDIGQDFEGKDGWRMYHGETVPGFPSHPHRGFETVTIVRNGYIDHTDSLGAKARFGMGDVQWLTAGAGIVHSEMFPLLNRDKENPVELFQIWLNLPAKNKMVSPHFTMFWHEQIPHHIESHGEKHSALTAVAGPFGNLSPLRPPPNSWASEPDSDVAIWPLRLTPGVPMVLPKTTHERTRRVLYCFEGDKVDVAGEALEAGHGAEVTGEQLTLEARHKDAQVLVLQGRPIGEPVVQYGPFVMNTKAEIQSAFEDYRRTQFGGWKGPSPAPVHGTLRERFAIKPDGSKEVPSPR